MLHCAEPVRVSLHDTNHIKKQKKKTNKQTFTYHLRLPPQYVHIQKWGRVCSASSNESKNEWYWEWMPSVQIIFKSKPLRSEVIKNSNGTTVNPCALWLDSFTALRHAIYRGVELISKEHHGKWTKSKGWELSYANYTNKDASWTFECFIYWERLKRCLFLTPEGSPDLGLTKRDGYSLVLEGE